MSHNFLVRVVVVGLILIGLMHFSDWWVGEFVDWALRMCEHINRLRLG